MTLTAPYPQELLRVAKKVVWYDRPEETLRDLRTFLAHVMVYVSLTDVVVVERYVPEEEFRGALENAPAGVFRPAGTIPGILYAKPSRLQITGRCSRRSIRYSLSPTDGFD